MALPKAPPVSIMRNGSGWKIARHLSADAGDTGGRVSTPSTPTEPDRRGMRNGRIFGGNQQQGG